MEFPAPLLRGRLLQRYKRFFVDIALDGGETITAHTPNTGSLRTCLEPDAEAWVSRAANPARKLAYTWELVRSGAGLVGVNTSLANALAAEAIQAGRIPELAGYRTLRREVEKEFGVAARLARTFLGPVLLWTTRREEKRLAAGKTYEPPTIVERSNWVEA